jgi:xanthine/CO dehydrogenase XdhC/CoxF family maturation factor
MVERNQILELASRSGRSSGVLVTLVRTDGSSYRKPGARLLTVDGERAGTISGGCLETEVVKKAPWLVRSGSVVERYSTIFDDASEIPYGLGCGGTVDLLLEPAGTPECNALLHALERSLSGEPSVVVTFLPDENSPMLRAVLSTNGEAIFASKNLSRARIDAALASRVGDVFVEHLAAPQRLIILGAGDDAKPLVQMASLLGWSVTVIDGRPHLARAERFPQAQQVLTVRAGLLPEAGITAEDAVVLMTHSYEQDRAWLTAVLPMAPRYLGVLGARQRSSLLVSEASALTGLSVSECCGRIYAPVGLDLGGDGPEAIALAVIAEAQACCMGRLGSSRRLNSADVPRQTALGDASRYIATQCALELSAD